MPNQSNIGTIADALGHLTAEQAVLAKKITALKAELVEHGETVVGEEFTVSQVAGSSVWTLDKKAIEAEFGEAWITSHSKIGSRKATVRVSRNLVQEQAA